MEDYEYVEKMNRVGEDCQLELENLRVDLDESLEAAEDDEWEQKDVARIGTEVLQKVLKGLQLARKDLLTLLP